MRLCSCSCEGKKIKLMSSLISHFLLLSRNKRPELILHAKVRENQKLGQQKRKLNEISLAKTQTFNYLPLHGSSNFQLSIKYTIDTPIPQPPLSPLLVCFCIRMHHQQLHNKMHAKLSLVKKRIVLLNKSMEANSTMKVNY